MIYHMSIEDRDGVQVVPCCGKTINELGPDDSIVIPEGQQLSCPGYLVTLPPPDPQDQVLTQLEGGGAV